MDKYKNSLLITVMVGLCFLGSISTLWGVMRPESHRYTVQSLVQPSLNFGVFPWSIRSVDTQVISKHWENVYRDSIRDQVALIRSFGANYVAIATPYDRVDDMRLWVEEIHNAGMNVWFRSHWNEWEGDEGRAATMRSDQYLENTKNFIINNPDLFIEGDSFTLCVEPEQVGVGLGKRFLNWDEYKTFMLDQIYVSNEAFAQLGLKGKVYTNWLSVNGWVVENIYDQELVDQIGLITVDHYVGQTSTIGEQDDLNHMVKLTIDDLNSYFKKFNRPIFLGEWGYQIFQEVSDVQQANAINLMLMNLKQLNYFVGMNYWVNMGNSASIIGDQYGSNLTPRLGSQVLKSYYNPLENVVKDIQQ